MANKTMMKLAYILVILSLFSCKKESVTSLSFGNWGTEHAWLTVASSGNYLEFDCAHATFQNPQNIKDNKFEVAALYFRESGAYLDDESFYAAIEARVSGEILKNGNLKLTLFVGDDLQDYGTYMLVYNKEARVYKCA